MLRYFLCVLMMLFGVQMASADWSPLKRAGTLKGFESGFSCGEFGVGSLVCAARYYNQQTLVYSFRGLKWSKASSRFRQSQSNPVCFFAPTARDPLMQVRCATETPDPQQLNDSIFYSMSLYENGNLSGLYFVSASIASTISCANYADDMSALCAWRSVEGALVSHDTYSDKQRGFPSLKLQSAPSCAPDGEMGVICAAVGPMGSVVAFYLPAGKTSSWSSVNIGGTATSPPECASYDVPGQVICFVRGLDLKLYVSHFTGPSFKAANWSPWGSLGGSLKSKAGCADLKNQMLACAVIGLQDDDLYVTVFNKSWSWYRIPGVKGFADADCARLWEGKALCTMLGTDGGIYYTIGP